MHSRSLIPGFTSLLLCQSAGEVLARLLPVGLPGPVLGMLLMLFLLRWEWVRQRVGLVAQGLLGHLSLLFVPVGVGVMTHLELLQQYRWQIVPTLLLSTWIGLLVSAGVLHLLSRRGGRDE